MTLVKDIVSSALVIVMAALLISTAIGIAWVLWAHIHPIVGGVVGLLLPFVACFLTFDFAYRVGRNLGLYGHVFDLRDPDRRGQ